MKRFYTVMILAAMTLALAGAVRAQFADQGLGGGIGFGGTFGQTELRDRDMKFLGRAFLRYGLTRQIQGEISAGLGTVAGPAYRTQIVPVDYRFLLSPFAAESWNAYLYAGAGLLHYNIEVFPPAPTAGAKTKGWSAYAPFGGGLQFMTNDNIALEMSGGYNYMFSDNLNAVDDNDAKDGFWSFSIGLTAVGESGNADPDHDGLTNAQERELGTNKRVADTDGDGLSDGEEVNTHKTSPLKDDSDGDGLKDGDEVKVYRTDANKADTDGDGLNDNDEVNKYKTDPNKADTDGDGLSDGDEILKHKTDAVKADTDGDGLSDGEEVTKRSTDPLKADTDGGTVNDGTEVNRGSNPLEPADDVKKEELVVEVGKAIVLDGVVFASGKSDITPESEAILEKAYNTLNQNPDITVEIQGHTDNTGSRSTNTRLSLARAAAVKAWLVAKGIAETRIETKGFGPDKPIAPNTTVEGRQKNRRIEFFRTK